MKAQLSRAVLATLATGILSTGALAHELNTEERTQHWLEHVAAESGTSGTPRANPFGSPASNPAERIVEIDAQTHSVSVTRFEKVTLRLPDQSVTWQFDTLRPGSFSLGQIVPGTEHVTVYVQESPLYVSP